MGVKSPRRRRVALTGNQPGGTVVGVPVIMGSYHVYVPLNPPSLLTHSSPVSLVIARDDVQQHQEPAALRQLSEAHPDCRKHPPGVLDRS